MSADTYDYELTEDEPKGYERKSSSPPQEDEAGKSFFNLSGGILKEERSLGGASLDDLLYKLMSHTPNSRLAKHVDRNLDYLHTSLQLDLIRVIAEDIRPSVLDEEHTHKDRIVRSLRGSPDIVDVHEPFE